MDIDERPEAYLQSAEILEPDGSGMLWRLPVEPSNSVKLKVGPIVDAAIGLPSYTKRCKLIEKNWRVSGYDKWIPEELRHATPYSLALLSKMTSLSSRTKGLREECHVQFLLLLKQRQELSKSVESPWIHTTVDVKNCETTIMERLDGLMLADVQAVIETAKDKTDRRGSKLERVQAEIQDQQAKAVQRVLERREAKQNRQAQLQRELWKGHSSQVELVDIEWADDSQMTGTPETVAMTKKQMRRAAKRQCAKETLVAKAAARLKAIEDIATKKGARNVPAKSRATTITQLASKLEEEDDHSWSDSDSASDADERDMILAYSNAVPDPDDLEPKSSALYQRAKARKDRDKGIPKVLASINAQSSHAEHKRALRNEAAIKERTDLWVKKKLASSVRLPSERMDFSTLGRLESGPVRKEMTDMMGALNSMGVDNAETAEA